MYDVLFSQWLAIISLIATGQGLSILLLILSSSNQHNTARSLLAVYIALNCMSFFIEYFLYSSIPLPWFISRLLLLTYFEGPLFYLYVLSLVTSNFRLRAVHMIHGLSPLFFTFFTLFPLKGDEFFIIGLVQGTGYNFLLLLYLIGCVRLLPSYDRFIRELFSSVEKINLDWLYKLVIVYFIATALLLVTRLLSYMAVVEDSLMQFFYAPNTFVFIVLFYLIGIGGYRQKSLPISTASSDSELPRLTGDKVKYRYSTLGREECNQLSKDLNAYMLSQEPYLEEGLTSLQLAEAVGISAYQLSQVLNTSANQSFYDYINSYRVEKARQLIEDHPESSKAMLDIGIAAGFSNKTTFYKHFKKTFAKTPLQYKKSLNTQK